MRPNAHLVAATALLTLSSSLAAAAPQGAWSDEFDQPGLLGRVFAVGEFQGEIVAGGLGIQADGEFLGKCARFDGTHWRPMGEGLLGDWVNAFAQYQGELVVGGFFVGSPGVPAYNIARWDGTQWRPLGAGIAGIVRTLEVYQGELYAAGEFTSAGGQPVKNIARWDGVSWRPVGGGLDKSYDPEVIDLLAAPDGKLYASGEFDTAGGATIFNVAAWDGSAWSALGGGLPGTLNARVRALEWYQGRVYAGGNFDLVAGGANHEKVASWDGVSWSAAGVFDDGTITGTEIQSLTTIGTDLYACGNIVLADGVPVQRLARFDGSQWSAVGGIAGSDVQTTVYDSMEHQGKLVVGGEFSQIGFGFAPGEPIVCHSVGRFDGASWESLGQGLGFNAGVSDAVLWNGDVIVVGNFTEAGDEYVRGPTGWPGPVRLGATGWTPLGDFAGQVRTAIVWNGDLVVAGSFTQVDGQPIQGVARYDGVQWTGFGGGFGVSADRSALAVYQGQLYAGGTGGVKRWNGTSWETFAPQLFGQVSAMHVHQSVLYIGGSMWSDGHIVSWDGTTQQTVGGGTSNPVVTFESYQGNLLVGGWFGLRTWDGAAYTSFPGITGPLVQSMTIFQGDLYAGGNLIVPGLPPNKYVARWTGSTWEALGGGVDGQPAALVPDEVNGRLYAGGAIAQADGRPARYFARWDTQPMNVGDSYCGPAFPNSTGLPGVLSGAGSPLAGLNDLRLIAEQLPAGQFGYFLASRTQGFINPPGSSGILCLSGDIGRFNRPGEVIQGPTGTVQVDLTGIPVNPSAAVLPGETWNFQCWYRDAGSTSNFTDGLSIAFQ